MHLPPGRTSDDFPLPQPYMPWWPVWKQRFQVILILLRSKIVKHFQKKFFLRKTVQIGRDCIDTVFLTAKWFNLKSKILEIFTVSLKKSFFLKIQGYDQRRTEILGFYCLLTKPFYETLIINLFMCRMLVDNKKFILKLNKPVSIKNLSDQLMTLRDSGARSFSSNNSNCCGFCCFSTSCDIFTCIASGCFSCIFLSFIVPSKSFSSAFVKDLLSDKSFALVLPVPP